eukprot:2451769-Prymnesium_polylepis.1
MKELRGTPSIANDLIWMCLKARVSEVSASAMLDDTQNCEVLHLAVLFSTTVRYCWDGMCETRVKYSRPRGAAGVMPTGSESGDDRGMRPPQEAGAHG